MREYYISGWVSGKPSALLGVRSTDVGIIVGTLVLMLIFAFSGQGVLAILCVIAGAVAIGVLKLAVARKEFRGDSSLPRIQAKVLDWSGITHNAGSAAPTVLSQSTVLGYQPDEGSGELALVEHPATGPLGLFGAREWVAVVELGGSRLGVATLAHEESRARQFGRLANALSAASMPVVGIDMCVRVTPWDPEPYSEWAGANMVPSGSSEMLRAQVDELRDLVAAQASQHRAWMVVRIDVAALSRFQNLTGMTDTGVEARAGAAWDVIDQVVRLARMNGLAPLQALTPVGVGAMARSWLDPAWSPDDQAGVDADDPFACLPPWTSTAEGLAVQGAGGRYWAHIAGLVPTQGWPPTNVTADMWSGFVDAEDCPLRGLQVSFKFVHRRQALRTARVNSAVGQAQELQTSDSGKVSEGSGKEQADAAGWALRDITHGSAGVTPLIRVMASAPSMRALRSAQTGMDSAMAGMGFTDLTWPKRDQTRQVLEATPLGWPS